MFEEINTHFGNGNFSFDETKLLWYKKGEFIIKFDTWKGITPFENKNEYQFENGVEARVLKVCKYSTNTLVLFEFIDPNDFVNFDTISYSDLEGNTILSKNFNYILYSPGGDDTPVARRPPTLSSSLLRINKKFEGYDSVYGQKFKDEYLNKWGNFIINSANKEHRPILAIIDTGLDINWLKDIEKVSYLEGFNLVDESVLFSDNIPFDDDYEFKHGSRIAEIVAQSVQKPIVILPIKAFTSYGKSDLFSILCSFEICINHNVNVINASWGFYCEGEIEIFRLYILLLKENNIWLINAAGNSSDFIGKGSVNIGAVSVKNLEALSITKLKRYPSCYSSDFANVITVTSLKSIKKLIPEDSIIKRSWNAFAELTGLGKPPTYETYYNVVENYSKDYVSIGVLGPGENGIFLDPFYVHNPENRWEKEVIEIVGSSYAVPYVANLFLKAGLDTGLVNRELILSENSFFGLNYIPAGSSLALKFVNINLDYSLPIKESRVLNISS